MDDMNDLTSLTDRYFHLFLDYVPKIVGAIVIFIIGLWMIKLLTRYLNKLLEKRNHDEMLRSFLTNIVNIGLKILLMLIVISHLGIQTTSLIAVIGAAGLAVGMALQGSLANFAGGVLIILLKPFKIGDYIIANGMSGTVKEVSIFYTKIINDNKLLVVMPNGELSNKTITNVSAEGQRLDVIPVTVAHGSDISKAREVLINLMAEQKGVFENPGPGVTVGEVSPNGIKLSLTFTSKSADFWRIHFDVLENIEKRLKEKDIQLAPSYQINLRETEGKK